MTKVSMEFKRQLLQVAKGRQKAIVARSLDVTVHCRGKTDSEVVITVSDKKGRVLGELVRATIADGSVLHVADIEQAFVITLS